MFVRKKRNQSGSISIQIVDKSNSYQVIKTIGCSKHPDEIERFVQQGKAFLSKQRNQYSLFPQDEAANGVVEDFISGLSNSQIRTIGPELIFGVLFDRIGFNSIPDQLFRDIVIARLAYPTSKLKTIDYLYKELEHLLNQANFKMSPKRAAELTHNMYQLHYSLPNDPIPREITLKMDPEQKALFNLIYQ